jgi:DNA-binding response OmpR family regulator
MAKKILIVDDEPHILELIKAVLEVEKFEIITAVDGKEALKKLETIAPDLVLLDMMMPGMSGREVCESIRKNKKTKNQKVIFLTVARFSETGKKILDEMKVSDYITKPFDTADLVDRINKVLGSK